MQKLRFGFIEGDCGNLRTTTAYDQSLLPFFPLSFSTHTKHPTTPQGELQESLSSLHNETYAPMSLNTSGKSNHLKGLLMPPRQKCFCWGVIWSPTKKEKMKSISEQEKTKSVWKQGKQKVSGNRENKKCLETEENKKCQETGEHKQVKTKSFLKKKKTKHV